MPSLYIRWVFPLDDGNFPIRLRSLSWQWHCFFPDLFDVLRREVCTDT